MEVILAGYNLDVETLNDAKKYLEKAIEHLPAGSELVGDIEEYLKLDNFTPETLSAAYARISRNPAPVPELREVSRHEVDRSRRSNKMIIFGLGHSSVAEHAVFNFDILGVSRRVVEEIQHFRLTSFTEKSQRYILLADDHVIPPEIRGTELEHEFQLMVNTQNQAYHDLFSKLQPYVHKKFSDLSADKNNRSMLDGWAKEDARYVVALATEAQMGMTVNARTFENMLRRLSASPLQEAREFARKAHEAAKDLAPSVVKYVEPDDYTSKMPAEMRKEIDSLIKKEKSTSKEQKSNDEVTLVRATPKGDSLVLEGLLMEFSSLNIEKSRKVVAQMNTSEKIKLLKKVFHYMQSYHIVPRAFERVSAEYELVVSASCYGQLKRHRMCTQIAGPYDTTLGNSVPEAIAEVGMADYFMEVIDQSNQLYKKIYDLNPVAADYVLTNSHRRRLFFKANLRELYHFSRLREDIHAQWDIRNIGTQMMNKIRKEWPLTTSLLAGKDKFSKRLEEFLTS